MNYKSPNFRKGFGLVEIVIASAIISTAFLSIATYFQRSIVVSRTTGQVYQASFLLEEGIEAVKLLRDDSWPLFSTTATTTDIFLTWNGTKWATTSTNTFIDGLFERKFVLDDVFRDANDDIATTGTFDFDIRRVTVSVSWLEKDATTTKSISTYVANIFQ